MAGEHHTSQKMSSVSTPSDSSTSSTPVNNVCMCTSVPAALEKQSVLMVMVKERFAQRSAASGSMRKHASSMRSPIMRANTEILTLKMGGGALWYEESKG